MYAFCVFLLLYVFCLVWFVLVGLGIGMHGCIGVTCDTAPYLGRGFGWSGLKSGKSCLSLQQVSLCNYVRMIVCPIVPNSKVTLHLELMCRR